MALTLRMLSFNKFDCIKYVNLSNSNRLMRNEKNANDGLIFIECSTIGSNTLLMGRPKLLHYPPVQTAVVFHVTVFLQAF